MTLLTTRNLSVTRKGTAPLPFADLSLRPGERLLLLGPSGSGKTTLLSVLAGLLAPTSGNVVLDGKDLYALPPRARDRLRGENFGFVFQTLHLLSSLTLRQNIALAADMSGHLENGERISQLISRLGLQGKENRKPPALSQGEQQRGAIARAMLNKPRLILADEPTSALDDGNTAAVMALLSGQAAETGAALIVATHDRRIAPHFETVIHLETPLKEAA